MAPIPPKVLGRHSDSVSAAAIRRPFEPAPPFA
jgi:hypothetical protein